MSVDLSENCSSAACWCRQSNTADTDGVALSGAAVLELMRAVLERQSAFRFTARGQSMAPVIHDGDVLTIDPLAGYAPGIGDVVAARHPASERLLIHRIVGMTDTAVVLRGDNNLQADGNIPRTHLLGIVTRVERHGRLLPWPRRGWGMRRQHWYVNGYRRALRGAWGWLQTLGVGLFGVLQRVPGYRARLRPVLAPQADLSTRVEVLINLPAADAPDVNKPPSDWLPAVVSWRLLLSLRGRVVAAATLLRCPPGCASAGWWLTALQVRSRYRGLGLEEDLLAMVEQTLREGWADGLGTLPTASVTERAWWQRQGYADELRTGQPCAEDCAVALAPIRVWKSLTEDVA